MPRHAARKITIATTALALLAGSALPASALDVRTASSERVLGDLQHEKIRVRLDDGEVARGDVLRFREDDPAIELRPRLAQRQVTGLQRVDQMAQADLGRGAVAGTNGGYWIDRRSGNPNGLHVQAGRLTGSNATASGGGHRNRSALGIAASGRLLLDQVTTNMSMELPGGDSVAIRYQNRRVHAPGDVVLYDDSFGDSILVPADGLLIVLQGLTKRSGGTSPATVSGWRQRDSDSFYTLGSGEAAVVFHRSAPQQAARSLRSGHQVTISTEVVSTNGGGVWPSDLAGALPAGGTLLRNGRIPSLTEWTSEAFPSSHFTSRQPRTAIGRTSNGEILLVTIDGRQKGWSVGVSGRELATILSRFGARDAVNLDGGGSSTMTTGGRIVNRPSTNGRSVASGLFLHTEPPPSARSLASACPDGRYPRNRFSDVSGGVHGAAVDCLAWWGVTQGTSANSYSPANPVTRAQMASFLARFLDGAASRGNANSLPSSGSTTFRDVTGGPHASAISRLADVGIVQGRGDGTFNPSGHVTRDQMASFIRRAVEHATGNSLPRGRDTFVDDNGSTHEDSINRLAGIGVASGVGGFDYRPRAAVRRDAMASLVMRGADFLVTEGKTTPPR